MACGVASEKPSDLLLLVEISLSQVHRMFTEMKDRLADVIQRHSLLAYKYRSVEEGPASGGKELHVFQRQVFNCITLLPGLIAGLPGEMLLGKTSLCDEISSLSPRFEI